MSRLFVKCPVFLIICKTIARFRENHFNIGALDCRKKEAFNICCKYQWYLAASFRHVLQHDVMMPEFATSYKYIKFPEMAPKSIKFFHHIVDKNPLSDLGFCHTVISVSVLL